MKSIKQLELAAKHLSKIKELDKQIIQIEKVAMIIAECETEVSFKLDCKNLTQKDAQLGEAEFDEDGSLISQTEDIAYESYFASLFGAKINNKEKETESFTDYISDNISVNSAMAILGIMLNEKQIKRNKLLKSIQKAGFDI